MQWSGRLGVPYQGSKNKIACELLSVIPSGRRFCDLFAGGCAMTHAAILSGRYESFLANDIHGFGVRLFVDGIAGRARGRWREWVSRADFEARHATDPLIALCWSFGNNMEDYVYSIGGEAESRAAHERFAAEGLESYHAWMRERAKKGLPRIGTEALLRMETVERLESLSRLGALSRIEASFGSYEAYEHRDGDVVYCDIPYRGVKKYRGESFDHDAFWSWVDSRPYPVFVSEYTAPAGFVPMWHSGKRQLMPASGNSGIIAERLFVAARFAPQFQTDLFLTAQAEGGAA